MSIFRYCASAAALLILLGGVAQAEIVTLTVSDKGWYSQSGSETGLHDPDNQNYLVGRLSEEYFRNFFVFDLTDVMNTVTGAKLAVNTLEVATADHETYRLYDVGTDVDALTAGGSGKGDIFADLGSGVEYGGCDVAASYTDVEISLTAALSALNAARGGKFAIGGALTSLINGSSADQYIFGFSEPDVQLILQTVPEPGTFLLLFLGAATAFAFMRKRPWRQPQ